MKYEGLLTDSQKRAGYFVTQNEDFVFVWHRRDGNPLIIAIFLYEDVKIKQIRDYVERHRNGKIYASSTNGKTEENKD